MTGAELLDKLGSMSQEELALPVSMNHPATGVFGWAHALTTEGPGETVDGDKYERFLMVECR